MSSGYCTKLGTEHCSIIRIVLCGTTFTLLKKRCQCFVDAPMLRSHRRQRPLTDNKEKPQPHCDIRQAKTFLFIVSPGIQLQEGSVYSKAVVICLYCERFAGKFDVDSSRNRIDTSPEFAEKRRTV